MKPNAISVKKDEAEESDAGVHHARNKNASAVGRMIVPPPPVASSVPWNKNTSPLKAPPAPATAIHGNGLFQTHAEFSLEKRQRSRSLRRSTQSTSWLSSIIFHLAGLLLLLLIVSPADFGGTGMNSLVMSLDQDATLEELAVLDTPPTAGLSNQDMDGIETLDRGLNRSLLSGIGSLSDAASAGLLGSARGSFFGIEAGGHEFVYIVDMSGSMRGRRFDRASEELIRSVEQLGPHQKFYVLLFSSGTVQLFGRSDYLPTPVNATAENKQRLTKWLRTAFEGGGTDPREALQIAMRMNPSAIFILSDGEFNGQAMQRQEKLLGGNADAFSMVSAATTKPPIHAIAFEDRRSRDNMERLASMTEGEFRFVPLEDGVDPAVSLDEARSAIEQGNVALAETLLHKAITGLMEERDANAHQLRINASEMLLELAKSSLDRGDLHATRTALTETVRMDETATSTGPNQTWLVEQLLENLRNPKTPDVLSDTLSYLQNFFEQFPNSTAAKQIQEPLARILLTNAQDLQDKRLYRDAVRKLEFVMTALSETSLAEACQAEHEKIGEELLKQVQELRQQQGDVASARFLRQMVVDLEGTLLQQSAIQALERQAREMLAAARDANMLRNRMKRNEIQQTLADAFGDDPLLERVQQQLASDERKAKAIMRAAVQLEQVSRTSAAAKYRMLVENYSNTIAAGVAEERLRLLGY